MSIVQDIIATSRAYFKIGLSGVRLKNNIGNLAVRNSGDTADAEVTASKINVSGDVININSDAAGAGADWAYTIQRPASGMGAALNITLPATAPTAGQVLGAVDSAGNLQWSSAGGSNASSDKIDTTSLAFGSTSPVTMFSTGAGDIVSAVTVIVDTPFNGTPSVSVGVAGTTSKYMAATDLDLTVAGVYKVHPGLPAAGAENLIATYSAGGASVGAARILVDFATPS